MNRCFTIAGLAKEFGITARTLRFYEDRGLIDPERKGQSRVYTARDRARVALILRGKRLGFSLAEIGELLDLYDLGDGRITQHRMTLTKFRERIAALKRQREDIDLTISELDEYCDTLENMLGRDKLEKVG